MTQLYTVYTVTYIAAPHEHWEIFADKDIVNRPGFDEWSESPIEHKTVLLPNSSGGHWRYNSPFPIKITRNAADIPSLMTRP